jgi:hypothetical protein
MLLGRLLNPWCATNAVVQHWFDIRTARSKAAAADRSPLEVSYEYQQATQQYISFLPVLDAANRVNMPEVRRFSALSPARQKLVRISQAVNFGELQSIPVRDGDPIFDHTSLVILDAKLDKEEVPRPELDLTDFALSADVLRLMSRLDELKNGRIQRLEVRAGLPRRLVFESRVLEPGTVRVNENETHGVKV